VAAVIACMDNHTNLMGMAVVGTVLMLSIQLSQLVAAVIVRRWWCVAGGVIGLAVSVFVILCSIVALAAGQYRPPVIRDIDSTEVDSLTVETVEEDFSFPVEFQGAEPTIADFMTAIITSEDPGEWFSYMNREWQKYRQGHHYTGKFTIKSRYICYDEQDKEQGDVWISHTEFCCWNCTDERYLLVGTANNFYRNGVPYDGQFGGISFYLYDLQTHRMDMAYNSDLGVERPDIEGVMTYSLPTDGTNIVATVNCPERDNVTITFVWNGQGFLMTK
jgi:hypothetical protein